MPVYPCLRDCRCAITTCLYRDVALFVNLPVFATSIVVVHGSPGVGKSEIVRRVAEYASDRFIINHFAGIYYIPLRVRSPFLYARFHLQFPRALRAHYLHICCHCSSGACIFVSSTCPFKLLWLDTSRCVQLTVVWGNARGIGRGVCRSLWAPKA